MNKNSVLNDNVLVLNCSWVPIHITSVRDAIGLIYVGAAKFVVTNSIKDTIGREIAYEYQTLDYETWCEISERTDNEEYEYLKSVRCKHIKPSVIACTKFSGIHSTKYEIRFSRSSLYTRDNGKCQYCGVFVNKHEATIDHIVPKSKGGLNTWSNTVLCCKKCNRIKGSRLLNDCGMTLLSKPSKPSWIAVKFGAAKTIKEKDEWTKFTKSVSEDI